MNEEQVTPVEEKVEEEVINEPVDEVVVQKKNEEPTTESEASVTEPQAEAPQSVRCPDCPLRAGLKDENTLCPTCNGTGLI